MQQSFRLQYAGYKTFVTMQAQTVANFYLAFEQNLAILPVLNKCDMRTAEPDAVAEQMQQVQRPAILSDLLSFHSRILDLHICSFHGLLAIFVKGMFVISCSD